MDRTPTQKTGRQIRKTPDVVFPNLLELALSSMPPMIDVDGIPANTIFGFKVYSCYGESFD